MAEDIDVKNNRLAILTELVNKAKQQLLLIFLIQNKIKKQIGGPNMTPEKIARINELAKKKKTEGLTPEEKVEQAKTT